MAVVEIAPDVWHVGVQDWDRTLFDEIIPLPEGTSYNSFLIKGSEKVALIDTVDPTKTNEFVDNLKELECHHIDYIIANHAEQDHSGSIPIVLDMYPMAKVVTNQKCKDFLIDLLHIPEDRIIVINDGDTLSLGNKTLEFIFTPWVHWPETMSTYLREDKIMFTCDFFGSHLASSSVWANESYEALMGAKRYYAEIMMPFRTIIKGNIEKVEKYDINILAPSHGPLYKRPEFIINAYKDWISDDVRNEVVVAYVSMHGSTLAMVERLVGDLIEAGLEVKVFNLTKADIGELAMALVDTATLVLAVPTFLTGPHPLGAYAAYLANVLKPKLKFMAVLTSYGWGGITVNTIKNLTSNLRAEIVGTLEIKGHPTSEDMLKVDQLAMDIVEKHREIGLIKEE